jgi:hypothetical protein
MEMTVVEQRFPSPHIKWISDLCNSFCGVSPVCGGSICKLYIGAFTKIAWIDLTKTVAGGMGARYGRALPIPVLTSLLMLGFTASFI